MLDIAERAHAIAHLIFAPIDCFAFATGDAIEHSSACRRAEILITAGLLAQRADDLQPHEWTCGHVASAHCSQCYRDLARRAHELAEENLNYRERYGP